MEENFGKFLLETLSLVLQFLENLGGFLMEKLSQVPQLLENLGGFLMRKINEALPPETRAKTLSHWARVGAPVILAVGLTLLFLYCGCCRKTGKKMMKAPGRKGAVISRTTFQSNPISYFKNLRGRAD